MTDETIVAEPLADPNAPPAESDTKTEVPPGAFAHPNTFIVSHINVHDKVFYTSVSADNADAAAKAVLDAHEDNILIEVLPPERMNPPTDRAGGHPTVVALTDEP
jgi:formaldehyde-activating enzyme involved in methanogenesis